MKETIEERTTRLDAVEELWQELLAANEARNTAFDEVCETGGALAEAADRYVRARLDLEKHGAN